MLLTFRWFAFTLVSVALLLLAGLLPFLLPVVVLYSLAVLAVTLLDWRAAGHGNQFHVERAYEQKLSLGVPNPVTLTVVSRAPRPSVVTVRDEPPQNFVLVGEVQQDLHLEPRDPGILSYAVRPLQRGDYRFGNINLRWPGPLGMCIRQTIIRAAAPVKVYPNIYEIRRYELLVRRDQLAEMGLRNVRARGEGTAFESLRDYTPDDPYRSINWKATARRGKPISMQYEPERSQRIIIMLDVGRMMRSAIHTRSDDGAMLTMAKVDFVINSTLLLSYVAARKGDQVGLLVFADQVKHFVPPAPGGAQFQRLLEVMYALGSEPVEADYKGAISYLKAYYKKRALIVLFTDLSGARAGEALLAHLPRLAPHHLPLMVTIRDPVLDDAAHRQPITSDLVYRRAVAEQLIDERRLLLEHLQRQGVFTLDVDARRLSSEVVNRYLELKGRMLV